MKIISLIKEFKSRRSTLSRWILYAGGTEEFPNPDERKYKCKIYPEYRKDFDELYKIVKGKTPKQEALLYIHHEAEKFKQIALAILRDEKITAFRNKI